MCSARNAESPKWLGQCPSCNACNALEERSLAAMPSKSRFASLAALSSPLSMDQIVVDPMQRHLTGIEEMDRVLGGGLVAGSIGLLGGDPGIGKSALTLQALDGLARQGLPTLYVTGEESSSHIALRARRMGLDKTTVRIFAETQLDRILRVIEEERPFACVIDSIQTMYSQDLSSALGSCGSGARMRRAPDPQLQDPGDRGGGHRSRDQGRLDRRPPGTRPHGRLGGGTVLGDELDLSTAARDQESVRGGQWASWCSQPAA